MKPESRSALTVVLFAIYLVVLVAVILFKFPFNYQSAPHGRDLNLIPLAGSFTHSGVLVWGEIGDNVLIFIPFGIYICMLQRTWPLAKKILPIVATSVVFETIQYVFVIGRADITDVLSNTLGGVVGIGVYALLARILGSRTNRVLSIVILVLTSGSLLFLAFLFSRSLRHG
jgi:glycopeptide antibiotics resistance protein